MKGAREYAELLGTGTFEKLSYESNSHARGRTFHIWIIDADGNRGVEVYGIVSGNPGWTEEYGWLHSGGWVDDFEKLVKSKKLEKEAILKAQEATTKELAFAEELRIQTLLSEYK